MDALSLFETLAKLPHFHLDCQVTVSGQCFSMREALEKDNAQAFLSYLGLSTLSANPSDVVLA